MELVVLGTGAADGWPSPFCTCGSCQTMRIRGEIRGQTSALIDDVILLDCGPETPRAAERAGRTLTEVHTILLTHAHPDHVGPAVLLWRSWAKLNNQLEVVGPTSAIDLCRPWVGPADPVTFTVVDAEESLHRRGYTIRTLAATHAVGAHGIDHAAAGAVLYDVTGPDDTRILYATDTGPLTDATYDCLALTVRDAPFDLVLLEETFGDRVLFGLATSLWLLYAARILGGVLSAATLPVSAAYVADMTTEKERGRGMAWLGTAVSLGVVVGPALGGLLSRRDWHFNLRVGHLMVDSFSIPFFTAAFVGLLTLFAALRWLPESLPSVVARGVNKELKPDWRKLIKDLRPLLALAFAGQLALSIFEGTFALFAQAKFNFGPVGVGSIFVVCGLVMTVFQAGAVGFLAGRIGEIYQIGAGFAFMGTGIALLATARTMFFVFAFVALLALGMAFIAPNLAALISKRGGQRHAGMALGVQNAANSLGQAGGPLLGGALFVWQMNAPYLLSGALLIALALVIAWKALESTEQRPAGEQAL